MEHDHLFAFEHDFVESLRCVPMAVRIKLDRAGIKLGLKQWNRFTHDDRRELLQLSCDTAETTQAYRTRLVDLVALRSGEIAKPLPDPVVPVWNVLDGLPPAVITFAYAKGVRPPTLAA